MPTSRGRTQDRRLVAGGQAHEVRYEAKKFGVDQFAQATSGVAMTTHKTTKSSGTSARKTATKKTATKTSAAKKRAGKKSAAKKTSAKTIAKNKVKKVMHERKAGTLRSGKSGKKVTSRKQAIAIGLSEARKAGATVPKKKT